MRSRLILDTHVLVRWLGQPSRLSSEQRRLLLRAERQDSPLGLSAITLVELARLERRGMLDASSAFVEIAFSGTYEIVPITVEIARESAALAVSLHDPADCIIAATARVHGLPLVTSDQRIIDANLVSTIA